MPQLGEGTDVAAGGASDDQTEEKKKCHLIVRVKQPSGQGPWYAFGMLGGSGDSDDMTGHAFCAHEDEGGSKKWHGFYPLGAIQGWDAVPAEDRIVPSVRGFLKEVAGILYHGDADHAYSNEKIFVIERPPYDAAESHASNWEAAKTKYSLARRNCTTYVKRDASSAGCSLPFAGPFANPASLGKRLPPA
jgi:hypothetical protein